MNTETSRKKEALEKADFLSQWHIRHFKFFLTIFRLSLRRRDRVHRKRHQTSPLDRNLRLTTLRENNLEAKKRKFTTRIKTRRKTSSTALSLLHLWFELSASRHVSSYFSGKFDMITAKCRVDLIWSRDSVIRRYVLTLTYVTVNRRTKNLFKHWKIFFL